MIRCRSLWRRAVSGWQRHPLRRLVAFRARIRTKWSAETLPAANQTAILPVKKPAVEHPLHKKFFLTTILMQTDSATIRVEPAMPVTSDNVKEKAHRVMLLRQATGYIELAEIGSQHEEPPGLAAARLLDLAIELLDELPAEFRRKGDPLVLRAEALRMLGRFTEALPHFRAVVAERPNSVAGWLGLGWCLKRLDRLAEAITALTRGVIACPSEPILSYNLSCYHSLAGNVTEAVTFLTRAIASDDRFRSLTTAERDFDPIRDDPRFVEVTEQGV